MEKENELVIAERMLESALSYIDGGFLEWDILSNKLYVSLIRNLQDTEIVDVKEYKNMHVIESFH